MRTARTLSRLCLVVFAVGCARTGERSLESLFSGPVAYNETKPDFRLDREVPRYAYPDLENADGTITRLLWTEPGQAPFLIELIKNQPAAKALISLTTAPGLLRDPNNPRDANAVNNEALVLVGQKEHVHAVTDLVNFVVTSPPLIEIEARVVEVAESDESGFGIDFFVLDRDHAFNPADPDGNLSPTERWFDRARARRGLPLLSDSNTLPSTVVELGTIAGDLQLDVVIQALKAFNKADVLSAPKVAVINGFKALFEAVEEIPIFRQTVVGNSVSISTEFKKVGITLEVTPRLVSRDVLRMAVKTTVQSVTGALSLPQGNANLVTPIISSRTAQTYVDVHDGAAVVIGGLLSTSQSYAEDKVPILGEIPVLDLFFTSRRSAEARSNLLFFIRPRVISPAGDVSGAVIVPPPESRPAEER